jgi:uncharacterized protein (TIGR02145 family)
MRWIILVFTSLLLFFSCKKIERINPVDGIVGVQTSAVQQLDLSSVQIGSTLQVTEEVPYVTQRGVCWSMKPNPTIANDFVAQGSGFGTFQSEISGLAANTTYYFRSFASNEKTTVYSSVKEFMIKAPYINTVAATNIKSDGATLSGNVVSNSFDLIDFGVLWGSFPDLTYSNNKIEATSKTFSLDLKGLQSGKKYYFRTYANTNEGVAYGEELSFTTSSNSSVTITDSDGNSYKTVQIGTQFWMAENLKTSKYSDGTTIPNITDNTQWTNLSTGAWCYYDNNSANNSKYGKLYNWYAVSPTTNGNKNVCPTGWHVPTNAKWTVLTDYLGGEIVAGGKMKEVGTISWNSPNTDATNTTLFTGLPGGYRTSNGGYYDIGDAGVWWSSSENNTTSIAWSRYLYFGNGVAISGSGNDKVYGLSVRCLRD